MGLSQENRIFQPSSQSATQGEKAEIEMKPHHFGRKLTTLRFYFSLCYYSLQLPFKPERDESSGRWELRESPIQKFSCWLMWATTAACHLTWIYQPGSYQIDWNPGSPKRYFQVVWLLLFGYRMISFTTTLVSSSGRAALVAILNELDKKNDPARRRAPPDSSAVSGLWWTTGYALFAHGFTLWAILVYTILEFRQEPQPGLGLADAWILEGKQRFSVSTNVETRGGGRRGDVIFVILELALRLSTHSRYFLIELFFSAPLPLTLWTPVTRFVHLVQESSSSSSSNSNSETLMKKEAIIEEYRDLKELSDKLNSSWSLLTFLWVLESSMNLIFDFHEMMLSGKGLLIGTVVVSVASLSVALFLYADVYRKMSYFGNWLLSSQGRELIMCGGSKDKEEPPSLSSEWKIMLREVDKERVGIGTDGFYKLHYGFIALLLTVVITLFVLSFDK